jgi:hypothetical protein
MEPHIFKSKDEAIKMLFNFSKKFEIPNKVMNDEQLVNYSVGGSIFRAFHLKNESGSNLYRKWAKQNLKRLLKNLKMIKSQKAYDLLVINFTNSFINYWANNISNDNEKIGFGPASKIVNLLIKIIQQSENHKIKGIDGYLHVPFDLYTLRPLKNIINSISNVNYNINIPSTATMGFIINESQYFVITNAIRNIAKEANIVPILYEYWGWDRTH